MTVRYRLYSFLAPQLRPVYQFTAGYLSRRLRSEFAFFDGQTYDDLHNADFSFICGLPYVLRTPPRRNPSLLQAIAAPVLQGERYQNRPIYFSDVIVHYDSPYRSFADLRGCSWAYNEPESQSGYGITRYHLVRQGETNGYFGRVVQAGFHQKAIRMVAEGRVEASAIDSQVLAVELRENPQLAAKIRVVDSLGPSTIQPFAAAAQLPDTVKQDVQGVLVEMHQDDEARTHLNQGLIGRFNPVDDAAYDDIRQMLAACERADFMLLR